MSFLRKLKDRLFKSSSKIEDGLEQIVDDGGVLEPADEAAPETETAGLVQEAAIADPLPEPGCKKL